MHHQQSDKVLETFSITLLLNIYSCFSPRASIVQAPVEKRPINGINNKGFAKMYEGAVSCIVNIFPLVRERSPFTQLVSANFSAKRSTSDTCIAVGWISQADIFLDLFQVEGVRNAPSNETLKMSQSRR
jgi:ubiquitin C-terminal hydrolase